MVVVRHEHSLSKDVGLRRTVLPDWTDLGNWDEAVNKLINNL
jgi:hypothetical protein